MTTSTPQAARHRTPTAPIDATASFTIGAPLTAVYAFVSDLTHIPLWNRAIITTDALFTGPVRQGARYVQTRTVPHRSREIVEITGWVPNRLLELVSGERGHAVRYSYEFESVAPLQTRVVVKVIVQPDHPVGMPDLYQARLTRIMESNLVHLDAAVRSAVGATPVTA